MWFLWSIKDVRSLLRCSQWDLKVYCILAGARSGIYSFVAISTFMGAPKDLNLIYVVERDIYYKTVSQFLDNLFLKEFMVLERTKGKQDFGIQQMKYRYRYLLITVPIAEQKNQTMNKHIWLGWLVTYIVYLRIGGIYQK